MDTINRDILKLAIPCIVTNVTIPLLGWVDLVIAGHAAEGSQFSAAEFIGAVTLGTMVFNVMYWLFGFLRMSTSGLTAQAFGARDGQKASLLLRQSLFLAICISLVILLMQVPIRQLMFFIMHSSSGVWQMVTSYFHICIWGAPAVLAVYSLTGWFIGMQNTRYPMMVSIGQNIINIVCSLFFVFVMKMQIEGIAFGTLIAQWTGLVMALGLKKRMGSLSLIPSREGTLLSSLSFLVRGMGGGLRVSRDIFLRTVCLVAVNLWFVSAGARQGDLVLAANALLMIFFTLFSYVSDGFAYAGEALSGRFYGGGEGYRLFNVIRRLYAWGARLAVIFSVVYLVAGVPILSLFTDSTMVLQTADGYLPWALLIPIASFAAFVADGVCIGTTQTRHMLTASALATLVFFAVSTIIPLQLLREGGESCANHYLWLALILYLLIRSVVQTVLFWKTVSR